jgi:hypothetical protein
MGKTIFQAVAEQGALQNARETLLQQLRIRFKKVPEEVEGVIQATEDLATLNDWAYAFATARKLDDIPFHSAK